MTPEKVIKLLKQLGIELDLSEGMPAFWMNTGELQRFAQLVRNEVLEEAAVKSWSCGMDWHLRRNNSDMREVGSAIANEIRGLK